MQEVSGDELAAAGETNLVSALSGRVSGVTITNSNTAGGSSRIVIRGANSLTAGNQPLFIVDGVHPTPIAQALWAKVPAVERGPPVPEHRRNR